jgi:UDP-glucose 4-epimerase
MNILLIGGSGFLGMALASYFTAAGHYTVIVARRLIIEITQYSYFSLAKHKWEDITGELNKYDHWVVIGLAYATVPNTSFDDPVANFSENLTLINKHLSLINEIEITRYIYILSGGTVYGRSSECLLSEYAPNFPLSPYDITKMTCEWYVNMYHKISVSTLLLSSHPIFMARGNSH